MSRIKQLDSQIANMIAAGEVVERPMGVVKELVENAIDAGSTRIEVSVIEGGITSLTVEDNGCGMDHEDARNAFLRHATSKISQQNDLWNIHTLGFRGEALPSIASVSKLTLCTSDGEDATRVVMEYGEEKVYESYACPTGTSITVEGLFYKTPARLKHLRAASYEASLIQSVIHSFALSHPEIAFRFINEGRDVFRSTGNNNLLEVLFQVYGRGPAENAVKVDFEDFDYHVSGYVVKPVLNRANRNGMQIFLNGRMVKDNKLYKAVMEGYEGQLPQGRFPVVVLHIEMDPHILDVNVHPSKWEVRLSKFNQLEYLLKTELKKVLQVSAPLVEVQPKPIQQTYYRPMKLELDTVEENTPAPVVTQHSAEVKKPVSAEEVTKPIVQVTPVEEVPVFVEEETKPAVKEVQEEPEEIYEPVTIPSMEVIGMYRNRYILCQSEAGLVVVDDHSLRQRMLYEKLVEAMQNSTTVEDVLVPYTLHVSQDVIDRLEELNEAIQIWHIAFEEFGKDTLLVRSIPSWMKEIDVQSFLQDITDAFLEDSHVSFTSSYVRKLVSKNRIKKEVHYSIEECRKEIELLKQCKNPVSAADGKTIFVVVEDRALLKEFK